MKIKVKIISEHCPPLTTSKKGEWIDLRACPKNPINLKAPYKPAKVSNIVFDSALIPLGFAMQLPKYFEANVVPRSSVFKNYGIILANSMGIIDSSYCGDKDEWKFQAIALVKDTTIFPRDRIAQFRIRPSQFAPWWVKIKWLFTSKITFQYVKTLNNMSRGGFGSTGIN